jgi:hypothetical protein
MSFSLKQMISVCDCHLIIAANTSYHISLHPPFTSSIHITLQQEETLPNTYRTTSLTLLNILPSFPKIKITPQTSTGSDSASQFSNSTL